MENIRSNVFETNSSSTHSITISNSNNASNSTLATILPDENGTIYLTGGLFGWEYEKYNSALTKANYCAIACDHYDTKYPNKEMLIEVVKKQTGAKEVIFNIDNNSYIDHQSIESGILEKVFKSKENLRNFIFNKRSWLIIDNDNHD